MADETSMAEGSSEPEAPPPIHDERGDLTEAFVDAVRRQSQPKTPRRSAPMRTNSMRPISPP